jgi:flagellar basal-body rod modification protein FlgD
MDIMPTSTTAAINQANNVGIEQFLRILSSQLNNQDPLKPIDNQDFLSQIAQFSSLQQSQALNQKVDQLLVMQAATQSIGLLGRDITFNSPETGVTAGRVAGLSFNQGMPLLNVNTATGNVPININFSQLISIR